METRAIDPKVLVKDGHLYKGEYVATEENHTTMISHSRSVKKAYNAALEVGVRSFVLTYVPLDSETIHVFQFVLNVDLGFSAPSVLSAPGPYLKTTFTNPHTKESIAVNALVDTGADLCVIPRDIAELIGHEFEKGTKISIASATGNGYAYSHTMVICVGNYECKTCMVSVVDGLKTPLLGVRGFLEYFELQVSYPQQCFQLLHPAPARANMIAPDDMSNWPRP